MKRFWTDLFDLERRETPGEIIFFRIFELITLYWVLLFAWQWAFYIQKIGDVVLPLGIAQYLDVSFMFDHMISVWNAVLITVAAAVGFLRLNRYGYLGTLLLLHLQYVSRYSLGEISHGSNVAGIALLGMALGLAAFRDPKWQRRFAIGLTLFFLGWGYFTAAMSKLIASGPLWIDGGHMWMWIEERTVDVFSKTGVPAQNWLQQILVKSYVLSTLTLAFGLITEFFGFLIWFKKTRPYIMTLLIVMHVGILLSMQINFPANNVLLLVLAYPWADWIDRLLGRTSYSRRLDGISRRLA